MTKTKASLFTLAALALVVALTQTNWGKHYNTVVTTAKAINKAVTVEPRSPVQELGSSSTCILKSTHVRIVKTGVFSDDTAYGRVRCSYEITDLKTGRRYIGISGIGIAELNAYNDGENMREVE